MNAHPGPSKSCPLGPVDRRLADAHRLWHQAEGAYFDPDGFRLAAQTVIQTLRTVTFILQKNKRVVPDFEEWYGKWQKRLHADPLMCWMHDARNKIEKVGDLETHSFVRAEVLASHLDEGPQIEVPAHLFESVQALLRNIPNGPAGEYMRRHGVLRIQRRWVEKTLPDYELLDAVAIAYGKIAELVHDAHRQIGLNPPQTIHGETGERYDLAAMGWRLPCMIGHELPRMLSISLADGTRVGFEKERVDIDRAEAAALAHYGVKLFEPMRRKYKTEDDLAIGYFELARAMFLHDGYHISILFLFRDREPVSTFQIDVETQQEKYLLMKELSAEVTKTGADAAFIISEVWTANPSSLKPYERPADLPTRQEALTLTLVRKTGEPLDIMAMIVRDADRVSLAETQIEHKIAPFEFAAFYRAWGRPIPSSWIEAGETASRWSVMRLGLTDEGTTALA
jgi:hypothetical protein